MEMPVLHCNDLRQSYRTIAQSTKMSKLDIHLLMNHAVPGVNEDYITRDKLLTVNRMP
jgi:hypothetical protein